MTRVRRVRFASVRSAAMPAMPDAPLEVAPMPRAAGLTLIIAPLVPAAACLGMLAYGAIAGVLW